MINKNIHSVPNEYSRKSRSDTRRSRWIIAKGISTLHYGYLAGRWHLCCGMGYCNSVLLSDINQITKTKNIQWKCLYQTKDGHPNHPSRLPYYKAVYDGFDMDARLEMLNDHGQDVTQKDTIIDAAI